MKYHVIACHVLWRELCNYSSHAKHVFTFNFLEQGLHNTPDVLRARVQEAVDAVPEGSCDAILLGYGLCSNGLMHVRARKTPLVVMRAHDCITFLLGSRAKYREYFDSHPGTYWYSPGWIDDTLMPGRKRYAVLRAQYVEQYGEENADYLMEMEQGWLRAYSNCAYVDLGFADTEQYKAFARDCAQWLGWNCDFITGDPGLVARFLDGQWEGEDFLVVRPGERIVPTHDERVIGAEPSPEE